MEKLFKSLLSIREIKLTTDDDYVDRLSRQYTVVMLICFAFLVSTKQFVGRPISCWCPAQFTDSHRDYANTVCWVSNTYYLPIEQTIPADRFAVVAAGEAGGSSSGAAGGGGVGGRPPVVIGQVETQRSAALVSYYQWVPFILLFQAVLAAVPSLLWRFFNKRSGIHLATIMDAARVCCRASYLEIREKAVRYIVNQMDRYLLAQREHKTGCMVRVKHFIAKICCLIGGRLYGNYLISAYLTIKMMYLANAIGQIFLLDAFLGSDFHLYGIYIVDRLIRGQDWSYSERFPRVTLCEFEIRHQSRVHQYVVQCALTINLFVVVVVVKLRQIDDQPLQREDLHIPLVLVRVSGAGRCRQHDEVAVPRPLLARAGPVRPQAAARFRRDAPRAGHPGQVHRKLPASRRHVHHPTGRTEHGRGGRRRGAVRTVEQLQSRAATHCREVRQEEDQQESTQRASTGGDVTPIVQSPPR